MKSYTIACAILALGSAVAVTSPAAATESLTAVFTTPDGGVTTGSYSGTVKVTVSGFGQSLGSQTNDAFYLFPGAVHDGSYYQLTFGTAPLIAFNPAQNAVNFIVGGLPAYSATHSYTFLLNTGLAVPGQLHFGVGDGAFGDNSGAFDITVSGVPEPMSWAMLLVGFGGMGAALRMQRQRQATVSA